MPKQKKHQLPQPLHGRINCRGCGVLNIPLEEGCKGCKRCKRHCICAPCMACTAHAGIDTYAFRKDKWISHPTTAECPHCGNCRRGKYLAQNHWGWEERYCACRSMPKWIPVADPKGSEKLINTLARPLGLEIELCDLGLWGQGDWLAKPGFIRIQIEHDGSVRGAASEAVVWPMAGDQFIQGVGWLNKYLLSIGARVDDSCGLHVHVGAQDFGPYEIRRLMFLYKHIEKDLYDKMLPKSRQLPSPVNGKYYCMKYNQSQDWWKGFGGLRDSDEIREAIIGWVFQQCDTDRKAIDEKGEIIYQKNRNIPDLRRGKYKIPSRYYGLNIHSWFVRGTVEWRHYPGTLVLEELLYWPLLCGWLTQLASGLSDDDVNGIRGGLAEVVEKKWEKKFSSYSVPPAIAEWVKSEMKKERV